MIPCCGDCTPDPEDKKAMRQYCRVCSIASAVLLIVVGLVILIKSF